MKQPVQGCAAVRDLELLGSQPCYNPVDFKAFVWFDGTVRTQLGTLESYQPVAGVRHTHKCVSSLACLLFRGYAILGKVGTFGSSAQAVAAHGCSSGGFQPPLYIGQDGSPVAIRKKFGWIYPWREMEN